jgi:uncharacterized membrane protein
MKKRRLLFGGIIVALVGVVFTGFAYGYRHFYSPEERINHFTEKISTELNLDERQRAVLEEIAASFKEKMVELHSGREQTHRDAVALVAQDQVTVEDVQRLMTRPRAKFEAMASFAAEQFVRFHAVLDAEQRAQLAHGIEEHALNARRCRFGH